MLMNCLRDILTICGLISRDKREGKMAAQHTIYSVIINRNGGTKTGSARIPVRVINAKIITSIGSSGAAYKCRDFDRTPCVYMLVSAFFYR